MLIVFEKSFTGNCAPKKEMLKRKGFHLASICVLCRKAEENVDHIFLISLLSLCTGAMECL